MAKNKNSGIELLIIFAIIMIIGTNIILQGNLYSIAYIEGGSLHNVVDFFRQLFSPGIAIFAMVAGYCTVRRKFDLVKSYKRLLKLYLTILFYSVVLSVIFFLLGRGLYTSDGIKIPLYVNILKTIFPVSSKHWSFLSNFFVMCLFAPFINIVLQRLTKQECKILIAICTAFFCILPILSHTRVFAPVFSVVGLGDFFGGENPVSFMYLYVIGGYIKLHTKEAEAPRCIYLLPVIVGPLINMFFYIKLQKMISDYDLTAKMINPIVIIMAVSLIMFFKDIKFEIRLVNKLASSTIGIYAIHEFSCVREILWNMFNFYKLNNKNIFMLLIYMAGITVFVFLVCTIIDLIRQLIFNFVETRLLCGKNSKENS